MDGVAHLTTTTSSVNGSHGDLFPHELTRAPKVAVVGNWTTVTNLTEVGVIQQHRQKVLREVCRRNPGLPVPSRFLRWTHVSDKLKVIYCGIPKCGTTSWTAMELEILGEKNAPLSEHFQLMAKHGIRYLHKMPRVTGILHKMDTYYKFLFVRHPLEKLLSAWKDKLAQQEDREYYHKKIGIPIIKKYRQNPSRESLARGNDTTFPEFVRYVIDLLSRPRVTVDQHIQFMHRQCDPCHIKYDFIGKMETFHADAEYVLRHGFHVDHVDSFPAKNQASIASSRNATQFYYSQVPPEHIEKLKSIYRLDIELFDYLSNIPGTKFLWYLSM